MAVSEISMVENHSLDYLNINEQNIESYTLSSLFVHGVP